MSLSLVGLEKEVRALKRDLAACEKANANLQKGRHAAEAREGATEGKLRLERQAREGMVWKPPCFPLTELAWSWIIIFSNRGGGSAGRGARSLGVVHQQGGRNSYHLRAGRRGRGGGPGRASGSGAWAAGRLRQEGCQGRGPVHPGTREVPLPGG